MEKQGYNGWSDRETWALNLHWSNDESMYHALRETCRDALEHSEDVETAIAVVREWLRDDLDDRVGRVSDLLVRDLVGTPDYHEVAKAWVTEMDQSIDDDPKFLDADDLREEYRLSLDTRDPLGSAMNALFPIAAELYFRDPDNVPSDWRYSPSADKSDPRERESYWFNTCRQAETSALIYFGNALSRIVSICETRGLSY